jgi:hypothetical protein
MKTRALKDTLGCHTVSVFVIIEPTIYCIDDEVPC